MSTSQNGWPVVTDSQRSKLVDPVVHGADFPNGWLRGDVDVVFRYLIDRLHREVEPIMPGGCWGWFVKPIEGSTTISNHSSGTAIDYNAPRHPMGTRNTYSASDRAKIHAILDDLDGVVRWGGDYSGRPDDMHFEINASAAATARVADRIREGDDVTKDELKAALREVMPDVLTAWSKTGEGRMALAKAVWTTDNVVSLDGPGATPQDAGGQSLVQWPRAGYAKRAADQAAAAATGVHDLGVEMSAIGDVLDVVHGKVDQLVAAIPAPPPPGE